MIMSTVCRAEDAGSPISWAELNVESLELELIDETSYELLMFQKEGAVSVTMGEKNGPLAAPVFYWRVEGDHLLITIEPRTETFVDLHEPRVIGSILLVKRGLAGKSRYAIRRAS